MSYSILMYKKLRMVAPVVSTFERGSAQAPFYLLVRKQIRVELYITLNPPDASFSFLPFIVPLAFLLSKTHFAAYMRAPSVLSKQQCSLVELREMATL